MFSFNCWSGFEMYKRMNDYLNRWKETTYIHIHFLLRLLSTYTWQNPRTSHYLPTTEDALIQWPRNEDKERQKKNKRKRPAVSISVNVIIYTSCARKTISYMHILWFHFVHLLRGLLDFLILIHRTQIVCTVFCFVFFFVLNVCFWLHWHILICCT